MMMIEIGDIKGATQEVMRGAELSNGIRESI